MAETLKRQILEQGGPPTHVAVIMDGNGRWARKRLLPRTMGHREGRKAVRRTVEAAASGTSRSSPSPWRTGAARAPR